MDVLMPVHIAAGGLGLLSGATALGAAKGGWLHRRSGRLFVHAMVVLGISGAAIAFRHGPDANAIGGLIATYLVVTALTTVRPATRAARRLDLGAALLGLSVGLASLGLAVASVSRGGAIDGVPTVILAMFAAIGLLGGFSDLRILRFGPLGGRRRLARHLWRMCWALWIAAASFFLGQVDVLPEPLRIRGLLALPVVTVVVVMLYWLWRVRLRGNTRGLHLAVVSPETAPRCAP